MYSNIGQGSLLGNIGNFADDYYWSSTENDNNNAWKQNFNNGNQNNNNKDNTNNVRAVRAFQTFLKLVPRKRPSKKNISPRINQLFLGIICAQDGNNALGLFLLKASL